MFGRLWRSRSSWKWWGPSKETLSVEEVRTTIIGIQSRALSVEEVRATIIGIQSRALSVEEVRATAIVKNSVVRCGRFVIKAQRGRNSWSKPQFQVSFLFPN